MNRPKSGVPPPRSLRGGGTAPMTAVGMASDAPLLEPPSSCPLHPSMSSPSPSHHFSQARHFYVAVDRVQFKMETLMDLLGVTGRRPTLPMVLCCSSRDELDAVCSAVSNLSYISLSNLYSDLSESERAVILEKFRKEVTKWNQNINTDLRENDEIESSVQKSNMIVATDACLPLVASGEQPLLARVLINFELPTKKETYLRRMTTCLAADGIVINMIIGGEILTLKSIEENCGFIVAEMPINISEIL